MLQVFDVTYTPGGPTDQVAFLEPLTTGSTTVAAASPDAVTTTQGSRVVTVTTPVVLFNSPGTVGSGLISVQVAGALSAIGHGGTTAPLHQVVHLVLH